LLRRGVDSLLVPEDSALVATYRSPPLASEATALGPRFELGVALSSHGLGFDLRVDGLPGGWGETAGIYAEGRSIHAVFPFARCATSFEIGRDRGLTFHVGADTFDQEDDESSLTSGVGLAWGFGLRSARRRRDQPPLTGSFSLSDLALWRLASHRL